MRLEQGLKGLWCKRVDNVLLHQNLGNKKGRRGSARRMRGGKVGKGKPACQVPCFLSTDRRGLLKGHDVLSKELHVLHHGAGNANKEKKEGLSGRGERRGRQ